MNSGQKMESCNQKGGVDQGCPYVHLASSSDCRFRGQTPADVVGPLGHSIGMSVATKDLRARILPYIGPRWADFRAIGCIDLRGVARSPRRSLLEITDQILAKPGRSSDAQT